MGRLSDLAGDRVHTRTLEMSTFAVDDTHFLGTGRFRDVRLYPSRGLLDKDIDAGTLHDMTIRVLVRTPGLVIEDIEVSIDAAPYEDCRTLERSLDAVVGLSVARGFTNRVKAAAGGKAGCTHLVNLLTAMAPAILQGLWALQARRREDAPHARRKYAASSAEFLKDSCHAWREDGPAFRRLREIAEAAESGTEG